jgi:hypothetical protein
MSLVNDDVLKLHISFLEKVECLSEKEREVFVEYFKYLSKPINTHSDFVIENPYCT